MSEVIIVGGGIIGTSIAYHLADEGVDTLLIDRNNSAKATKAGAGVLSPATSTHDSSVWYNFATKAVDYYPKLIDELSEAGINKTSYMQSGTLVVSHPSEPANRFQQVKNKVLSRRDSDDTINNSELYDIPAKKAKRLFPFLGKVEDALYYEGGARIDGQIFTDSLRQAGKLEGLNTIEADVDRLTIEKETVTGVVADEEQYAASNIVIAGGAWTPEFAKQLRMNIPIEPQHGQVVHIKPQDENVKNLPTLKTTNGRYLIPWSDDSIVVGATRETGLGYASHASASGVKQILTDALHIAPGLDDSKFLNTRAGVRPLSADELPLIGEIPSIKNAYIATGHGPTGLQLGPYTGKVLTNMILGNEASVEISAFEPSRFS